MQRRFILSALACLPAGSLLAQDGNARPRHKISAGELHNALAARFPVRLGIAGLLEVQVSAPRLLLLPARNLLGATLAAQVPGLQPPLAPAGEMDVVFALRYESTDQTVRAHRLEVLEVRWPGLPPETAQAVRSLLPALARDTVGEIVLHKLTERELALADTMGFAPRVLTVVNDGLLIEFGPKPRP